MGGGGCYSHCHVKPNFSWGYIGLWGCDKNTRVFQVCFKRVSSVFQVCFKCLKRILLLQQCLPDFHQCLTSVSPLFKKCFKSVSKVLQKCFESFKVVCLHWSHRSYLSIRRACFYLRFIIESALSLTTFSVLAHIMVDVSSVGEAITITLLPCH